MKQVQIQLNAVWYIICYNILFPQLDHNFKNTTEQILFYNKSISSPLLSICCVKGTSLGTLQVPRVICPEKAMAPYSSTPAWKIPWTEEPGRLQSMGLLRVRHDWVTSLSPFTFMHWRRRWQPIPVSLPGESQGWLSLAGCRLWGRTESDTTEAT